MAIYTTNAKSGPYMGDGSQTTFPFDFPVTDAESVKVYLNGALVESGVSVGKGEVTFSTPPSSGSTVIILRRVAITQETDIQNNTAFYPEIIETALDKLTMICQQFDEELDRCISVPVGENDVSPSTLLEGIFAASESAAGAVDKANEAVDRAEKVADEIADKVENVETAVDKVEAALKASAGIPIGAIFPFPASVPPEGAYLLNGQTIYGCNELYPKFWEWVNTAGVWIIDNDTYEAELAKYGVCDGFVVDSAAGSVRLPTKKYQTPLGETLPVRGNGALGITNGVYDRAVGAATTGYSLVTWSANRGGDPLPSLGVEEGESWPSKSLLGISADPDISGIVAENNSQTDHFVWCIQVYNAATALSEQQSAQLARQMQMRAQTDLANVTTNIDFIIKHEEAEDGSWWYDLYRSGKVVQGGYTEHATAAGSVTINLPIEMANNNYIPLLTIRGENGFYLAGGTYSAMTVSNITETSFDCYLHQYANTKAKYWRVEGKAATE